MKFHEALQHLEEGTTDWIKCESNNFERLISKWCPDKKCIRLYWELYGVNGMFEYWGGENIRIYDGTYVNDEWKINAL